MSIDKEAFLSALESDPVFAARVMGVLAQYLRADIYANVVPVQYGNGATEIEISHNFYGQDPDRVL